MLVHGDDFVFVRLKEYVAEIADCMTGHFQDQDGVRGAEGTNVLRVLDSSIKWANERVIYESDHRYADRRIEAPKQTVMTPAIRTSGPQDGAGGQAERPEHRIVLWARGEQPTPRRVPGKPGE